MSFAVRVESVTFEYPARKVLHGLTFVCSRGEFVGILGPNGSGKTTLLRTASGFLRPQQGAVYLDGEELLSMDAQKVAKKLAVVTQTSSFSFPFSVSEYVLMGRAPHLGRFKREKARDYEIARRAMELTQVHCLADRFVTELSGGEQRRVSIARALAQEPTILFLDEPTAALDINYQVSVMAMLRGLARDAKMALVAVLHDLNLASLYCDRLVLIARGQVYAAGEPQEVITRQNIKDVYGSSVDVTLSPLTGRPFVLPVEKPEKAGDTSPVVFVVAGGGSATGMFGKLMSAGLQVVAGVLNAGDADWLACKTLGIEVVEEEPFSPVSKASFERALEIAMRSDVLLLAETAFGQGNLANLDILKAARLSGKPVVVLGAETIAERDYTAGRATDALREIIALGAECTDDESGALHLLRRYI